MAARATKTAKDLDPVRIRENLGRVRARIAEACRHSGRDPEEVELLTATKYIAADGLPKLAEAGITLIGENRAQDLVAKHALYGPRFAWDFIGHLQTNKVRTVLPLVRLIHSVESIGLVKEIDRRAEMPTQVLLQVKVGNEPAKYGMMPSDVERFLEEASRYLKVSFTGLMTMPPLAANPEHARPAFAGLRHLAQTLSQKWQGRYDFSHLSMGTSQDFAVAVEEGATIVRVGNTLFE